MKISRRAVRIGAVLGTIAAFVVLAGSAQGATLKPAGMSNGEDRALMLRSEALNQKYGLGRQSAVPQGMTAAGYRALMLRSEALNQKYGLGRQSAAPQGVTAAGYRALMLRSEALNQKYRLGKQKAAAVTSQPTNSTRDFPWGAFGIGAAVMLGLALLAVGFLVRRRFAPRSGGLAPRHRTT